MFSTNGTLMDIAVEGLRFLAYLLLLIGAVIGIFSNMSMIQEKYRSVWYRCRNILVFMGLSVGIVQGITSMINIIVHQGWSAAIIPFTTASGRLANGCALIAFYITLAYVIPAIWVWKKHHQPSPRFISVLLYPVLELLLLSGLLTRNDSGILSIHLFYVFTGLCLIWLFVLQLMSGESRRRRERKHWWVSPDIKVGHQSSSSASSESKEEPSSLFHSKGF